MAFSTLLRCTLQKCSTEAGHTGLSRRVPSCWVARRIISGTPEESQALLAVSNWLTSACSSTNVHALRARQLLNLGGHWRGGAGNLALHLNDQEKAGELRISTVSLCEPADLSGLPKLLEESLTPAEWSHPGLAFTAVPTSTVQMLQTELAKRGRGSEPYYLINARLWTLPPETAITTKEAEEISGVLDSLRPEEAELVDSHWDMAWPGSDVVLRHCITERPSACLRIDDKPVCWAIVRASGAIGALYTLKEHRGQGYADSVVRHISAGLRAINQPVYCDIVVGNTSSERFFSKLGFTVVPGPEGCLSWLKLGCVEETLVVG